MTLFPFASHPKQNEDSNCKDQPTKSQIFLFANIYRLLFRFPHAQASCRLKEDAEEKLATTYCRGTQARRRRSSRNTYICIGWGSIVHVYAVGARLVPGSMSGMPRTTPRVTLRTEIQRCASLLIVPNQKGFINNLTFFFLNRNVVQQKK